MQKVSLGVEEIGLAQAFLVADRDPERRVGGHVLALVGAGVEADLLIGAVSVQVHDRRIEGVDRIYEGADVGPVSVCEQLGIFCKRDLGLQGAFRIRADGGGIKAEDDAAVADHPGREVVDGSERLGDRLLAVAGRLAGAQKAEVFIDRAHQSSFVLDDLLESHFLAGGDVQGDALEHGHAVSGSGQVAVTGSDEADDLVIHASGDDAVFERRRDRRSVLFIGGVEFLGPFRELLESLLAGRRDPCVDRVEAAAQGRKFLRGFFGEKDGLVVSVRYIFIIV